MPIYWLENGFGIGMKWVENSAIKAAFRASAEMDIYDSGIFVDLSFV